MKSLLSRKFVIISCVMLIFLGGTQILKGELTDGVGIRNLEASYHTLLTVRALSESPASNHYYLPTVTLGSPEDKFISWGATIPTKTGDYVYTSFYSPSFLVAYGWFGITHLEPTLKNLSYLNSTIGALSAFLLLLLVFDVLVRVLEIPERRAAIISILSVMPALFSHEVMVSHGLVYWAQSLYQLFFVGLLYGLFQFSLSQERGRKKWEYIVLFLLFMGPLVEWTGFIFNLGLLISLFIFKKNTRQIRVFALKALLATLCAGFLILTHYIASTNLEMTVVAFIKRFLARSSKTGSFEELLLGYWQSYGLFLLIILGAMLMVFTQSYKEDLKLNFEKHKVLAFFALISLFPLLENVILLQHASQFSFDRLKFIVPFAVIFAWGCCRLERKRLYFFVGAFFLAIVQNQISYREHLKDLEDWRVIHSENLEFVKEIESAIEDLDPNGAHCIKYAANISVRGYMNLTIGQGIYEARDLEWLIANREDCIGVYIKAEKIYPDLPHYQTVEFVN